MSKAETTNTTRRRFLASAAVAGAAAATLSAGAALASADVFDPVFSLIDAHRKASDVHSAAIVEQNRLESIDDQSHESVAEEPCHADWRSFEALIETAPAIFSGLIAWTSYLDEIRRKDGWKFEDTPEAASTLVATFAQAIGNLAVSS